MPLKACEYLISLKVFKSCWSAPSLGLGTVQSSLPSNIQLFSKVEHLQKSSCVISVGTLCSYLDPKTFALCTVVLLLHQIWMIFKFWEKFASSSCATVFSSPFLVPNSCVFCTLSALTLALVWEKQFQVPALNEVNMSEDLQLDVSPRSY